MNLDGNGVRHHAIQVFQVCHGMDWSPPTVALAFHASPSSPGSDGYFDIMRCTHTHTHTHTHGSATCLWPEGPHLGSIPSRVPVSCWNLSFQECRTALQTGPLDCGFRPSSGPKSRSIEKQNAAEPRRGAWKKSLTMLPNWLTKPWNSVKAWWFSWVPWGSKFSTEFKSMWKKASDEFLSILLLKHFEAKHQNELLAVGFAGYLLSFEFGLLHCLHGLGGSVSSMTCCLWLRKKGPKGPKGPTYCKAVQDMDAHPSLKNASKHARF